MAVPSEIACAFIRISFGPETSEEEVDAFLGEFRRIAERTRARAA
jgi:cysteine desulfurase